MSGTHVTLSFSAHNDKISVPCSVEGIDDVSSFCADDYKHSANTDTKHGHVAGKYINIRTILFNAIFSFKQLME